MRDETSISDIPARRPPEMHSAGVIQVGFFENEPAYERDRTRDDKHASCFRHFLSDLSLSVSTGYACRHSADESGDSLGTRFFEEPGDAIKPAGSILTRET